jgi:transposase-like protein
VSSSPGPRGDQPRRRTFTAEFKLAIVAEYDRLTEPGARGALLRREGLYHSHLIEWRRARDAGALNAPAAAAGAAKRPGARTSEQAEIERLRRHNERLAADLARTKAALDIVGKAHALLELLSESADAEPRSKR